MLGRFAFGGRAVRRVCRLVCVAQRNSSTQGRYEGKVTIVTGGSRGIGEGCVRTFQEAGSTVVFCGLDAHRKEGEALVARYGTPCPDVSAIRV